jgi:hypothetical protein
VVELRPEEGGERERDLRGLDVDDAAPVRQDGVQAADEPASAEGADDVADAEGDQDDGRRRIVEAALGDEELDAEDADQEVS